MSEICWASANGWISPVSCSERDLNSDRSRDTETSFHQAITVHDGSDHVAGREGLWDGRVRHSPLQSARHETTAYLTQSWSATLPGLALPKCSQDISHFFCRWFVFIMAYVFQFCTIQDKYINTNLVVFYFGFIFFFFFCTAWKRHCSF